MDHYIYILSTILFAYIAYCESKRQLHMAQLEGYKPSQYMNWLKQNTNTVFLKRYLKIFKKDDKANKVKKTLVFTYRAIRLFIINNVLLIFWFALSGVVAGNLQFFVIFLILINILLPFNMFLATVLAYPIEMTIQKKYYKEAQNKIMAMDKLKVIGITGSYGKTSTKYFLKTILSEKYNTLMTPESYNTPMGITKIIRAQLNEHHEVFICEMGARNVGDIKELSELTRPSIGIITSIGPQHLETFKTIENVAKTKYELIEALPEDGLAVFNGDNVYCCELAKKTVIENLLYSINNCRQDIYIHAEEIFNTEKGLKFKIKGPDGLNVECQTSLLGKHNISNILAVVCVALKLGLTATEIRVGISKIKPVPHRLELISTNNGVIVVDDAFNSNPTGAKEALETIRELVKGNRIVITPGMVELGTIEIEENKKFGRIMADCCDYAILVGQKRSKPIVEGLLEGNFSRDRIIITASLEEASAKLAKIIKAGDVVLFENDLPDNYNE
jgi:UDP-N-acetylmuramoyl-tripeptide--D-alanyl-D-alanine ligase